MFFVSMVLRLVLLLVALMFSPPVLLLCIIILLTQNKEFPSFNPRPYVNRIRRQCFGPCDIPRRQLRRFADRAPNARQEGASNLREEGIEAAQSGEDNEQNYGARNQDQPGGPVSDVGTLSHDKNVKNTKKVLTLFLLKE